MLRAADTQVRFDTVVAMGNIGAPAALTYLELMDSEDPLNDARVINARRETIYGIKKKNRMYPPVRKCPFCGGYDILNRAAPFKCHECDRSFGQAGGQSGGQSGGQEEADRGHGAGYDGAGSPTDTSPGNHGADHSRYMNNINVGNQQHSGRRGIFRSKAVRNLATLTVLLLLMLIMGALVVTR
jgi:hypothetical protein